MDRKILIIVENLSVPFDSRVWQEATSLVKAGYTVSVISPMGEGESEKEEILEGVNIFRHSLPVEGNTVFGYAREYLTALYSEYRLAKKVYEKIGFDVIMGCNPPDNIFLVAAKFRKYGVRYVFDHHDICPELFEVKFNGKKKLLYNFILLFERLTYKNCDFAFVTNESYKEIAISRGKMKPENVAVLRSAPRLSRMKIKPEKPELKKNYRYMVGYVGVIGQQEGLEFILQCAEYIKSKENDVLWVIIGAGPHLEYIRKLANEKNLNDCVLFTGRVSDSVMLDYLNTADVCINSDKYNTMNDKSTMNKIMEYMALGKPIVQFDLKEGRYSAQDASLYAKPDDCMDMARKVRYLLNNPQVRKEMGMYGRNRIVNELNWDKSEKILTEAFDKLFNPEILLIGPSPFAFGGIATVNRMILHSSFLNRNFRIGVISTWKGRRKHLIFIQGLIQYLIRHKEPDLVHLDVSSNGSTLRKLIISHLLKKTPYIVHLHSGKFAEYYSSSNAFIKRQIRKLLNNSEKNVFVSHSQKNRIEKAIPLSSEKSTVIYNGIKLTGIKEEIIERKKHSTLKVLFFGSLLKERHIDDYIKLADSLKELDIKFLIAGSGKERKWANHNVQYLGSVSGEKKEKVLYDADIVYDNFIESFGIGMVEAMNHGCCVLGLNDGAIPEIIQDNRCGLLNNNSEEFRNNLISLYNDRKLLKKLQESAYERSLDFSEELFEKSFHQLYSCLTAEQKESP